MNVNVASKVHEIVPRAWVTREDEQITQEAEVTCRPKSEGHDLVIAKVLIMSLSPWENSFMESGRLGPH